VLCERREYSRKEDERGQGSVVRGQWSESGGRDSESEREQKLILEVSRTWVPHETLGNFDRRELGVGVKIHKK